MINQERALIKPETDTVEIEPAGFYDGAENGYGEYGEAPKKLKLGQYWQAIWRHLWFIVGLTVIATVLMTAYVAQKPDYYRATARVQVNLESNPALSPAQGGMSVYDPTHFSSQLQILEGSGLLRRVVKTMDLEHNRAFLNPSRGEDRSVWENVKRMIGLGGRPERSAPAPDKTSQLAEDRSSGSRPAGEVVDDDEVEKLVPYVGLLKNGLSVAPVKESRVAYKETRLIDIKFTHYDPQVAAKVVNAVADVYVSQNLEKKIDTSAAAGDFMQKRIAELQAQIRSGEERLINYSKNNSILSLDATQNTVVQRLADLNGKLSQAESDRIVAEAAYRASVAPGAAAAQVDTVDSKASGLEAKLNELRHRREQLLVEFMEAAPEIAEVDKQIAVIERDVESTRRRATTNLTTNLETKYRETLAREAELRKTFNQQRGEVLSQNEAAINYRIIQQEIDTNKQLLDGLLQRSKENDVILTGTPNNVLVVDRALVPRGPVGPERFQYVALAFLGSLGAGLGLALLLNYLDDSVRTSEDVEENLRMPVLTEVPAVAGSGQRRLPGIKWRRRRGDHHGDYATSPALKLADQPLLSEAYMSLRTSVLLATAGGPPQTLLVTSAQPTEGKTTTAINFATVLAQTGAKVLLVDGDLRRPSLHAILGIEGGAGITTLLASKRPEAEAIFEAVKFHEKSGLYVLPSGPPPPNPATLLCSPQMQQLMTLLRGSFTHIVIDSPPTLFFTDSTLLSKMADGVLIVVRSGKSSFEGVQRVRRILRDVGANLFGVILNGVKQSAGAYDHYDYHYNRAAELPEGEHSFLNLRAG